MPQHIIRLVGPWQIESLEPPGTPYSVHMPRDWQSLFGATAGRARFTRRFQKPTNLDPEERVILEFTGIRGDGEIRLNEHLLGAITPDKYAIAFDITAAMKPTNLLRAELQFDPKTTTEAGGLYEVVRLVISDE